MLMRHVRYIFKILRYLESVLSLSIKAKVSKTVLYTQTAIYTSVLSLFFYTEVPPRTGTSDLRVLKTQRSLRSYNPSRSTCLYDLTYFICPFLFGVNLKHLGNVILRNPSRVKVVTICGFVCSSITRYLYPSHIYLKSMVLMSLVPIYHDSILLSLSTIETLGQVTEGLFPKTRGRGERALD